jgi:hypothetical protein
MAQRKRFTWLLYENREEVADEPAIFQLVGTTPQKQANAFDVADRGGALQYPPRAWWTTARRAAGKDKHQKAPSEPKLPPTSWADRLRYPPQRKGETHETAFKRAVRRLFRSDPLPGESKGRAATRVQAVRSYFGKLGAHQQAVQRFHRAGRYRITMSARAVGVTDPGEGEQVLGQGNQVSLWQDIARGEHSPSAVEIRALYLDTARASTRTSLDQHGPGGQLSHLIPDGLDYETVNVIPDKVTLEFEP